MLRKLLEWLREANEILYISDDKTDCAVGFVSQNLVTLQKVSSNSETAKIFTIFSVVSCKLPYGRDFHENLGSKEIIG